MKPQPFHEFRPRKRLISFIWLLVLLVAQERSRAQTTFPAFQEPTCFAYPASAGNAADPGFILRVAQGPPTYSWIPSSAPLDSAMPVTVYRANAQLAGTFLDPTTGLPFSNYAFPGPNPDGSTNWPGVINFVVAQGSINNGQDGNFSAALNGYPDALIPGIPGQNGDSFNITVENVAYLKLPAGTNTMTVVANDGFGIFAGAELHDQLAPLIAWREGPNPAASGTVNEVRVPVVVTQAGVYPFRLVYLQGGGSGSYEWYMSLTNGGRVLINDLNGPYAATNPVVSAFTALTVPSRPYVQSVIPAPATTAQVIQGVPVNQTVIFSITNGGTQVNTNTIRLAVNGTNVAPTSLTAGGGLTTVTYQPVVNFPANTNNTMQLIFADSAANVITNNLTFVTAPAPVGLPPLLESGGQVVIEAENFDVITARNGWEWAFGNTNPNGSTALPFSGTGFMEAVPNWSVQLPYSFVGTVSPELDYNIQFPDAGTYYIWVRGIGENGSSQRLITGIDGAPDPNGTSIVKNGNFLSGGLSWVNTTLDTVTPATVTVGSAGLHTFNVWMVNDGLVVDKFILALDPSFTPSGSGPQQGNRVGLSTPTVAITTPTDGSIVNSTNQTFSVTATAGAGLTITNIAFFVNNVQVGQATGLPYNFTLTNLSNAKTYILKAAATDSAGTTSYSPVASFTVILPPQRYIAGDVIVMRYGDGVQSIQNNAGNSMFFDEYKTDGTVVQTIPIVGVGSNAICGSAFSASEGYLGVTPAGNLIFGGYNAVPGANADVTIALPSVVPRAVGRMTTNGTYTIVGTITNLAGDTGISLNYRCAISDDTNYWCLIGGGNNYGNGGPGGGGGIYMLGPTPNPIIVNSNFCNPKHAAFHNGSLYFTSFDGAPGTNRGLWSFGGKPTNATTPLPVINNTNMDSLWGFAFSPDSKVLYIADDGGTIGQQSVASTEYAGLQRYDFDTNAMAYSLTYVLNPGGTNYPRHISVDFSQYSNGTNATIYVSAAPSDNVAPANAGPSRLYKLVDTGDPNNPGFATLAYAPANTRFRGVAFVPKLPPPNLTANITGKSLRLSWLNAWNGYSVQTTSTLNPANWVPTGLTPATDNTNWSVTIPLGVTSGFYRLIK